MKTLLSLPFIIFGFIANASNYYISSSSGNDVNPGTSTNAAWQTLGKLNLAFSSFRPGDSILFKRGDTFYGSIIISKSGTSGSPIIIGAYGTGENPVITGFKTVSEWTNLRNNIWESTNAVSTLPVINLVVINGLNTAMGRYPNTGYLTYQGFTGTSITGASLNSGATNWTGAIAVIRKNNWIIDRDTITAHSEGNFSHTSHSVYYGKNGYGFFIQNDSRTLDEQNEWYYNSSNKKLQIYSTGLPVNVQVSTIDTLVNMNGRNNITFSNISFTGSNKVAFAINFSHHTHIFNCNIDFSGLNAITTRGGSCDSFTLIHSTINHTNNNAIDLGGASANCRLSYDTIKNTGMFAGMGASADASFIAVQTNSDNGIVENCFIDSTGYSGIIFYGNNTIIRNNLVSNFCMTKLDGGGIYTFIKIKGTPFTGQQVLNNTVINGVGNTSGTTETIPLVHGIYLDEGTANVEVAGNTAANNSYSGLYYHSSYNNNVHNNTFYNNGYSQALIADYNSVNPDRNLKFENNILISKTSTQKTASFQSGVNDIAEFGKAAGIDKNYYARPIDDNKTIETVINKFETFTQRTLAGWQTYSGFDAHSKKSPGVIRNVADLRFEYNATGRDKTITLDANYIDVTGASYPGSITLAPYTSAVLIKNVTGN